MPLVSVVIVSYNSKNELPKCLESVRDQEIACEIFIVDNASADGSRELLESYSQRFPEITTIFNSENRGLAYANNQPINMCTGEYILVLNPDTVLLKGSVQSMLDYLELDETAGVVGPKCYYEDGKPHVSFQRNWSVFHIILRKFAFPSIKYLYNRFSDYQKRDVLYVSGACLMVRRELFVEIGGYDEHFFLAIEDVADLCLRSKQRGYRTIFLPDAEIIHLGGRSHSSLRFLSHYHSCQGSLYYVAKHKGRFQFLLLFSAIVFIFAFKSVYSMLLCTFFPRRYKGRARTYVALMKALTRHYFFEKDVQYVH